MATVDFTTRHRFERRIGRRVDVDPMPVRWKLSTSSRLPWKRPTVRDVAGRIVDVSLTGVGIVGPDDLGVAPGDKVFVRAQGRDNVVTVRHVAALPGGRECRVGVELTRWSAGLRGLVEHLLDDAVPTPATTLGWFGPELQTSSPDRPAAADTASGPGPSRLPERLGTPTRPLAPVASRGPDDLGGSDPIPDDGPDVVIDLRDPPAPPPATPAPAVPAVASVAPPAATASLPAVDEQWLLDLVGGGDEPATTSHRPEARALDDLGRGAAPADAALDAPLGDDRGASDPDPSRDVAGDDGGTPGADAGGEQPPTEPAPDPRPSAERYTRLTRPSAGQQILDDVFGLMSD